MRFYVGRTRCCQRAVAACCDDVIKRDLKRALADMIECDLVITLEATARIDGLCDCDKRRAEQAMPLLCDEPVDALKVRGLHD